LEEAKTLFESLTKDQPLTEEIDDKGNFRKYTSDPETQLRVSASGNVRIDRPIDINGKKRETIHFYER
ncbi:MAG TPA: hypothetical protein VKE72_07815, partial [Methylocella sp.]|nr:hypothetical protein [Methylocella sp.]